MTTAIDTKPPINNVLELQAKIIAMYEAGFPLRPDLRVRQPVADVILQAHELGPELREELVAMAIGAMASTIFERGGPILSEKP
jgi:hypothetical protein